MILSPRFASLRFRSSRASAHGGLVALTAAFLLAIGVTSVARSDDAGTPLEDLVAFPRSTLVIHSGRHANSFEIWVADTPAREEQGLMFVRDLPADRAMLFIESEPRRAAMWMKNTYIELDMVFIRADGRISSIARRAVPHSLRTIASEEPVTAVLEIRGGEADRRGIKVGDLVVSPALGSKPRNLGAER